MASAPVDYNQTTRVLLFARDRTGAIAGCIAIACKCLFKFPLQHELLGATELLQELTLIKPSDECCKDYEGITVLLDEPMA